MHRGLVIGLALAVGALGCTDDPAVDPEPTGAARGLAPCRARGVISEQEKVPACEFEGMEGEDGLSVAGLLGKPAVYNFWASWCTYCVREMPDFEAVWRTERERVTFVGLNVVGVEGETKGAAETFRRRTGVTYRMVYDPRAAFYSRFQPNVLNPVMPITVFADADGTVLDKHFGPLTQEQLRDRLRDLFDL